MDESRTPYVKDAASEAPNLSLIPLAILCYLVPLIMITLFTSGSMPVGKRFGLFAFGIVLSSLGAACLYFCLRFFANPASPEKHEEPAEETKILNLQEEFVFPLNPENKLSLEKEKEEWKKLANSREKILEEQKAALQDLEEELEKERLKTAKYEKIVEEETKNRDKYESALEEKDEIIQELKAKVQDLSYELKTLLRLSEVK